MNSEAEPLHFENYEQLLTALHATRNYSADPAAVSLLEFAHERIFRDPHPEANFDIHIYTTDSSFQGIRRSIIESIVTASNDKEAMPNLAIAAAGLLRYVKRESAAN